MSKIQTFIEKNHLDFEGSDSNLNSAFCILSGYALYLGFALEELKEEMTEEQQREHPELERVFEYAEDHHYGNWWTSKEAHEQYEF